MNVVPYGDTEPYLAVLILIILALVIATAVMTINKIFGRKPKEITPRKYDSFECGMYYEGDAHQQFSVRYYLVGIVFLLFDVEVVFMYPWALAFKTYMSHGPLILLEMLVFFALLLGGYFYLRARKALSWD